MNELDLEPIKQRLAKATPGPWSWKEDLFRPKYMKQMKNGDWKAKPGKKASDSWVMLLTGPLKFNSVQEYSQEDIIKGVPDEYDFQRVIALRWNRIKGTELWNSTPTQADADLIANAPSDIESLLIEVERLRRELKRLTGP